MVFTPFNYKTSYFIISTATGHTGSVKVGKLISVIRKEETDDT